MNKNQKKTVSLGFESFEALFRRNHRFLCMIALKYVYDPYLAEDIVQDFFINYWQRREEIQLQYSFEAYACQSVKNKCISWLRKQESADRRLKHYSYPLSEDPVQLATEAFGKDALELRILQLIDELPPERKKIFLLSTTGNLSYAQIAEKLSISVNTVKTQIVKAYAFLRKKAGPFFYSLILYCLFSER